MNESNESQVDRFFESAGDFFDVLAKPIKPVPVFLDVGSGNGYAGLKLAGFFEPRKIILTDIANTLNVSLPQNAEFHKIDVCSSDFLKRFQNRVAVTFCLLSLHEFHNVFCAIKNLFSVLPIGGTAFIMDRSYEGWATQRATCGIKSAEYIEHLLEDFDKINQLGLERNEDIKRFWEEIIFPNVPGDTQLAFNGQVYTAVYVARQWGDVKLKPSGL